MILGGPMDGAAFRAYVAKVLMLSKKGLRDG
jgi:hypothetical protein